MNVFLVGDTHPYSLEASYSRAFRQMGAEVQEFNIYQENQRHIRFGSLGRTIHRFWPVDAWLRKTNRSLAVAIKSFKPDLVIVFGNAPVLFSTLTFAKATTSAQLMLLWPDPLTNLQPHVQASATIYDRVATHSRSTVSVFRQLGFRNSYWLPLAADPEIHAFQPPTARFTYDLTFVGAWRPEREKTLALIADQLPHLTIGIWGTDWHRVSHPRLKKFCAGKPLRGSACAALFGQSRINLNIIDDTGYPAANMRFFEIMIAGGLQLCSPCPELENDCLNGGHLLYYHSDKELISQIMWALSNAQETDKIRLAGHRYVLTHHTYRHRAELITQRFNRSKPKVANLNSTPS